MGGKTSRTKGHSFERWVAVQLREIYPEARRHLEYHAQDARGCDIDGVGRYLIQCKRKKGSVPMSAIEEVQLGDDAKLMGSVPVLIAKSDRQAPLVVLPFEEFLRLVARDEKLRQLE